MRKLFMLGALMLMPASPAAASGIIHQFECAPLSSFPEVVYDEGDIMADRFEVTVAPLADPQYVTARLNVFVVNFSDNLTLTAHFQAVVMDADGDPLFAVTTDPNAGVIPRNGLQSISGTSLVPATMDVPSDATLCLRQFYAH